MRRGGVVLSRALGVCAYGALAASSSGCGQPISDYDDLYAQGSRHYVLCSDSIDDKFHVSAAALDGALMRAEHMRHPLHLYAHKPGETVSMETLEVLLSGAEQHGLELVTYEELARGPIPGSLALSFDDHGIAQWMTLRPLFARYHARATFFVSEFTSLTPEERAQLRQLADDGNDIEFHSTHHQNAAQYTAAHGVEAYVANEILPALQAMRDAGYPATVFAYPFGARTTETDDALRPYFTHLRAIRTTCPW
jgi:hypothetical protein